MASEHSLRIKQQLELQKMYLDQEKANQQDKKAGNKTVNMATFNHLKNIMSEEDNR